ncbi:RRM domain-containing protein [Aphelenchoides besseyi]|nr:RRM domain-containing protein [Aphelenchoides besseyi]KAI6226781.1 RRM domain-containing protein [Aphelenchoides besseyi]
MYPLRTDGYFSAISQNPNRKRKFSKSSKSTQQFGAAKQQQQQQKLEGVIDVIIYSSPDAAENRKNRGFCFVDFQDHKAASDAKRRLQNGKVRPWNGDLVVDWAEQQEEPDEETMAQVKVIYVKNLKESVTDDQLTELFSPYGEIDRVKKIRDYAFVHYKDRDSAVKAIDALKGTKIDDVEVEISLAKPQADKKKMPIKRGMPMDKHMGGGGQMYGNRNGAPRNNRGNSYNSPSSYGKSYGNYPPAPAYGYDQTPAGYAQAPPYYPPMDPYAYAAPDPYFAGQNAYGPPGGYSTGGYGTARGGYGGRGGMNSGGYKRGGMGGGIGMGGRGSKRRGDSLGGPASKRGGRGM